MAHTSQKITPIATLGCPACSHKLAVPVAGRIRIYNCAQCDALFGDCYLGESYELVLPYWVETEPPAEKTRYFDLTCLGSKGLTRRHGWYEPESRRIVQVG